MLDAMQQSMILDEATDKVSLNDKSRPAWTRFLPPGFREGKILNMVVAAIYYIFWMYFCLHKERIDKRIKRGFQNLRLSQMLYISVVHRIIILSFLSSLITFLSYLKITLSLVNSVTTSVCSVNGKRSNGVIFNT